VTPYVWIPEKAAIAIHDQQISEHGGLGGVRDLTVIQSALARPLNLLAYGTPDARPNAADLAAAYAYGLSRNHGFLDGNKRSGFLIAATFLDVNGYDFQASEEDIVKTMLSVASGVMTETTLAAWFRKSITKLP
jgi:death-on-curing protein